MVSEDSSVSEVEVAIIANRYCKVVNVFNGLSTASFELS